MTIRYAVVGTGWISQIAFMPGTHQATNSTMTALVTGSPQNARKLSEFYGIDHIYSYEDYDRMLADDVVDAVYIALPNSLHADFAIRAAKAGVHALVEKPLAMNEDECTAMIAAAEAAGTYLMTAYRLHNEPGTVDVIRQIGEGAIGRPRIFSSVFSFQTNPENHRLLAEHWGGPLQDIGVYCLNAARHIFGEEPIEASAMKNHGEDPRFQEVEEMIAATLRFPSGGLAQFVASFGAAQRDSYTVMGTEGELTVEMAYEFQTPTRVILRRDGKETIREFALTDHFAGQSDYFSHCIQTGTPPQPDGHEGLADVHALRAIEAASLTGQSQPIKSPPRPGHPTPGMVREYPPTDHRLML